MTTKPLPKVSNQEDLDNYNFIAEAISSSLESETNPTVIRLASQQLAEINERVKEYQVEQ